MMGEESKETVEECANIIDFDMGAILAARKYSISDKVEFDKGVKDVSRYIGQFSALINAGINSDTATVVMSWLHENEALKINNDAQVEISKNQNDSINKQRI